MNRIRDRVGPAVDIGLEVDVGDVALDGAWAQEEGVGNPSVTVAGRDQVEYFAFARCQWLSWSVTERTTSDYDSRFDAP